MIRVFMRGLACGSLTACCIILRTEIKENSVHRIIIPSEFFCCSSQVCWKTNFGGRERDPAWIGQGIGVGVKAVKNFLRLGLLQTFSVIYTDLEFSTSTLCRSSDEIEFQKLFAS
jgi:hypothetical protein